MPIIQFITVNTLFVYVQSSPFSSFASVYLFRAWCSTVQLNPGGE